MFLICSFKTQKLMSLIIIRNHRAATGDKYTIKALDSVIGANSPELRDKIFKQINQWIPRKRSN